MRLFHCFFIFIFILLFTSCQSDNSSRHDEDANGKVTLAKIGNERITLSEFRDWMPIRHIRQRDKSKLNLMGFLKRYIKYRVILKKAKSEGYSKNPFVIKKMNDEIVRQYVYNKLVKSIKGKKPSNEEIISYYRKNIDKFKRPKMKRFSVIVIACKSDNDKECLSKKEILEKKITKENFSAMARQFSSEPYSRRRGGDIGFIVDPQYPSKKRTPKGIDKNLLKQVFSMKKIGSIAPVIKRKRKFFIFMITASIKEIKMSFSSQKGRIIGMMRLERKKKIERYFYKKIYKENKVEIYKSNFERHLK